MPYRRELGALAAFVSLGWQRAATERAGLIGRALLYVVVLAIFSQLWRATPLDELVAPAPTAAGLLWYLAVTEWIVFAVGMPYREVEADIGSGQIVTAMLRPLPYGLAMLAQWSGAVLYRLGALAIVGLVAGLGLSGTLALAPVMVPGLLLAGTLSAILILLCQLQLGLATLWLGSAAPLFWIWQKLAFVLGGLIIPLTLYPAPWRALAERTPFASMLFAPGSLALDAAPDRLATIILWQILWLAFLGAATILVARAATSRITERGL